MNDVHLNICTTSHTSSAFHCPLLRLCVDFINGSQPNPTLCNTPSDRPLMLCPCPAVSWVVAWASFLPLTLRVSALVSFLSTPPPPPSFSTCNYSSFTLSVGFCHSSAARARDIKYHSPSLPSPEGGGGGSGANEDLTAQETDL